MKKSIFYFLVFCGLLALNVASAQTSSWHPVKGTLTTPWTNKVDPNHVLPDYPRPQMVREGWQNLDGLWNYAITSLLDDQPNEWQGKILVPFPIESDLSGVKKAVGPEEILWYQRTFTAPDLANKRLLLHFGAVDWKTTVWINGKKMGTHQGGYDAFTFDITAALKKGQQQIVIKVWDPSDKGFQPLGKQTLDPRGIWYTSTTGIWQTVWLEAVPQNAIENLKITPDIDAKTASIIVSANDMASNYSIKAIAYDHGKKVAETQGGLNVPLKLHLNNMKLWSPDDPFLYDLAVSLYQNGKKMDEVKSYFGMRKISLEKDEKGIPRLFLNNKALFQFGPLDQGFWPDGIYTAPTDEALKFDIQSTKDWGFNMIRKHVKVEPQRWYYWCDKIGMLVWQDMPSGDKHIQSKDPDIQRVAQSSYNFKSEWKQLIDEHYNHPSIVTWVPFNEGWGQYEVAAITELTKKLDPTRLVNSTTGWADRNVGDMHDKHDYPGPGMFPVSSDRASVLGEFGGQALVVKDHLWLTDFSKAPGHFKTSQSESALHERYDVMMDSLTQLKKRGLAAAVYTQTTDVEIEVNGIMSYDRKVMKFDKDHFKKINSEVIKSE